MTPAEECSAEHPDGLCPEGLSCIEGTCQAVQEECSPDNPTGSCPSGEYCLEGACVAAEDLCSAYNPEGECPDGFSCLDGSCVADSDLCSPDNPTGFCPNGEHCLDGVCTTEADPCSADNPTGPCPDGEYCLEGTCVAESDLCSADNPAGLCPDGQTCLEGTCVTESDLCSAGNPAGLCPDGQTCLDGTCVGQDELCSVDNPAGLCPGEQTCHEGSCIECGNGVIEGNEICDGDVHCSDIDFEYVEGLAVCGGDCSGYDLSSCEGNIELEGMAADIQMAAKITGAAQMTVLGLDLIGMYEWEVKEVIDEVFDAEGADALNAFSHIVASGPNAISLHYSGGDRMIQDGDLVLMDLGARYNWYCGDITRTIPANGTYSPRQRELYQLVLDAQTAVAEHMQPGVHSLNEMTDWVSDFFANSPLRALDENGVERTMDYFFIHSISHYIGRNVHGGDLGLSTYNPVEIGYVFSIEPGLYIESEGIGIRIEDDYVMTEDGAVNVYKQTPKTIEDVEAWMARARARGYPLQSILDDIEEPAIKHGSYTDHMNF